MNNKNYHLGHEALQRFEINTGIKANWTPTPGEESFMDGKIVVQDPRFTDVFAAEFKNEVRNHHLPALLELKERSKHPYILIAQTIFPSVKDYLRKNGINYIDIAGNVSLQTPQALIFIDGQKWQDNTHPMLLNRAFTKTGLRVVYVLLNDPRAINYSNRLLAELAGVSVGGVNNALAGLQTMGFLRKLTKTTSRIDLRETLVERWITGYQERLKPALHMGNFRLRGGLENWENLKLDTQTSWSGEPAAYRLRKHLLPKNLTIFTALGKLDFMKKYQLIPDPEGELVVYQQFWNGPYGEAQSQLVPRLLIYADLMDTMDPRCIEEAQEILKTNPL